MIVQRLEAAHPMDQNLSQDEAIHDWLWWLRHHAEGLYPALRPDPMPPEALPDDLVGELTRRMAETDWVRDWQSGEERQEMNLALAGLRCSTVTAVRFAVHHSIRSIHADVIAEGRSSSNPKAREAAKAAKAKATTEKVTPQIRADILRWRTGRKQRGLGWIVAELRKRYDVKLGRGTVAKIAKGGPSPSGS